MKATLKGFGDELDGTEVEIPDNVRSESVKADTNIDTRIDEIVQLIWGGALDISTSPDFATEKDYERGSNNLKAHAKAQIKQLITEELKTIANVGYDDLLKTYDYDAIAEALLERLAVLQGGHSEKG